MLKAFPKSLWPLWMAAALLPASDFSHAASASTTLGVSASVAQACTISTTSAIAFDPYDPIGANASAARTAVGQVSVTCSKGAKSLTVGMGAGAHAIGGQRQMLGAVAAGNLQYNLFQPVASAAGTGGSCPGTVAWTNEGGGLLALPDAPTKAARLYNVCGSIPGGQDVAVDTYSDTVSVTLNF